MNFVLAGINEAAAAAFVSNLKSARKERAIFPKKISSSLIIVVVISFRDFPPSLRNVCGIIVPLYFIRDPHAMIFFGYYQFLREL